MAQFLAAPMALYNITNASYLEYSGLKFYHSFPRQKWERLLENLFQRSKTGLPPSLLVTRLIKVKRNTVEIVQYSILYGFKDDQSVCRLVCYISYIIVV